MSDINTSPAEATNPAIVPAFGGMPNTTTPDGSGAQSNANSETPPAATSANTSDGQPRPNEPTREQRLEAIIRQAKRYGKDKAEGDDSLHYIGRMIFDGVTDGTVIYVKPKTGKKSAVAEKTDIDRIWDAYAENAAKVKHEGASLSSQKSKCNSIGAWAAGKSAWDQSDVLERALEFRNKIVDANKTIKEQKGKTKVHAVFQTMVNLAYAQLNEANADGPISDADIEAAVLKEAPAPKDMREQMAAFDKKVKAWIGDNIRTDDLIGNLSKAFDAILAKFEADAVAERDAAAIADLKARGLIQ